MQTKACEDLTVILNKEGADRYHKVSFPIRYGRYAEILAAFQRGQAINQGFANIEVTSNFISDPELPENHWASLWDLTRGSLKHYYPKGMVYLSPLAGTNKQAQLKVFKKMKRSSRLPMYVYLIQRL